jgi:hypothetical protein
MYLPPCASKKGAVPSKAKTDDVNERPATARCQRFISVVSVFCVANFFFGSSVLWLNDLAQVVSQRSFSCSPSNTRPCFLRQLSGLRSYRLRRSTTELLISTNAPWHPFTMKSKSRIWSLMRRQGSLLTHVPVAIGSKSLW